MPCAKNFVTGSFNSTPCLDTFIFECANAYEYCNFTLDCPCQCNHGNYPKPINLDSQKPRGKETWKKILQLLWFMVIGYQNKIGRANQVCINSKIFIWIRLPGANLYLKTTIFFRLLSVLHHLDWFLTCASPVKDNLIVKFVSHPAPFPNFLVHQIVRWSGPICAHFLSKWLIHQDGAKSYERKQINFDYFVMNANLRRAQIELCKNK